VPGLSEHPVDGRRARVAVVTPLEAEFVAVLENVDDRLEILHDADLLPPARYPGDHRGVAGFRRSAAEKRRWRQLLGQADVLFGIPDESPAELAQVIRTNPCLRWVQATAAGAGEQIAAAGLTAAELRRVTFTSASGVHAGPLAEFSLFGLLAFARGLPRLLADQRSRAWEHRPVDELRGRLLLILGLGAIGAETARLAHAFGMRVTGVTRSGRSGSPDVEKTIGIGELDAILPSADAVVATLPLTAETHGLIGAQAISRMKRGVVVVNVGRGAVIDEPALTSALRAGHIGGAALDVFATEPLPADSELWTLPNVIISPHTAALSIRENERIIALFTDNLRRWLRGQKLRSQVDTTAWY